MKKMLAFLFSCSLSGVCSAQTWDEWFRQKKTRIKYLEQQVAALQVYINTAEKGYRIVEDGIHTIRDIKNGEFSLHRVFFSSLQSVNPKLRKMLSITEIVNSGVSILLQLGESLSGYYKSPWLHPDELNYIYETCGNIINAVLNNTGALADILAESKLGMTDGERIRRIQAISAGMEDQHGFMLFFTGTIELLIAQRQQESLNTNSIKKLYGIQN